MPHGGRVATLGSGDLTAARALLRRDPVAHGFLLSRLEATSLDPLLLRSEVWGYWWHDVLVSLLYVGSTVVPAETVPEARAAFARRLLARPRLCSSLVGPANETLDLWERLRSGWPTPRDVRGHQPLLAIDAGVPVGVAPDPAVVPVRAHQLDVLLPACIAMFTGELGVSPVAHGGGPGYRARIAELVGQGRSYARIESGRVQFKAEVGWVSRDVCQVQGVWVDPSRRGEGLAAPGMAAVVEHARHSHAPVVSLYVNDFNARARAAYRRVGFEQVGTFATVLL